MTRDTRDERASALKSALAAYEAASAANNPDAKALALTRIADVRRERCEWDEADQAALEAQDIAKRAGLAERLIEAKIAEANTLLARGKFASAMPRFEEIATSSTDARVRGIAMQNVGSMLAQLGRFDDAELAFQESLAHFQEAGYARGQAIARNNLGRLALDRKAYAVATPLLQGAIEEAIAVGDLALVALAQENLATVLCETGEPARALELVQAALDYFTSSSNRLREIECLRLIGAIAAMEGQFQAARRSYERALQLAHEIGSDVEKRVTQHRLEALDRASHMSSPPARSKLEESE